MPVYRVTIRVGAPRMQYQVVDITASSLREAVRLAVDEIAEAADLVEIRRHAERESGSADEPGER